MANHISKHTGKQIDDAIDVASTKFNGTLPKAIGGFKQGQSIENLSISDVIQNLLFPYVAFAISSVTTNPTGASTVVEKGKSVSVSTVSCYYTEGTQKVTSASLYKNGTKTELSPNNLNSGMAFSVNESVTSTTKYKVELSDGTTTSAKEINAFTFVDPFFYGVLSSSTEPTSAAITAKTKVIQAKGNKTFSFTANGEYPFIAYPASYGNLTNILDSNGFDYITDFNKYTVNTSVASGSVSYYVYVLKNTAFTSGFNYTFKF